MPGTAERSAVAVPRLGWAGRPGRPNGPGGRTGREAGRAGRAGTRLSWVLDVIYDLFRHKIMVTPPKCLNLKFRH
jgi:hypothetical protein